MWVKKTWKRHPKYFLILSTLLLFGIGFLTTYFILSLSDADSQTVIRYSENIGGILGILGYMVLSLIFLCHGKT